jgi:5-methylcytosine-specific restriction endonuclease McrA
MSPTISQPARAARLRAVLERDGTTCIWCGRLVTSLVGPTTEHIVPRLKGGPSWLENEVAACRRCNGERGHRAPVDWLEECLRRGWPADEWRRARAAASAPSSGDRASGPGIDSLP